MAVLRVRGASLIPNDYDTVVIKTPNIHLLLFYSYSDSFKSFSIRQRGAEKTDSQLFNLKTI